MSKDDKIIKKCDALIESLNQLKKTVDIMYPSVNRKPMPSLGEGWSMDPGNGTLHHTTHGVISTIKKPEGGFEIKHNGRTIGQAGKMEHVGAHIKQYTNFLKGEQAEKSDYGPKDGGQYDQADNARRKERNVGDVREDVGQNKNVKAYSTRPGQLSAKQQAAQEARKVKQLSGPVTQYTPEQIAAMNEARKLKKACEDGPWMQHNSIPNADEEVIKAKSVNPPQVAEDLMANQLANLMAGKAMLGNPPAQPTDQELFGHLVPNEDMIKSADRQWNNGINDWLAEASRPISARFASEEEELAYWKSIKVADKDDGKPGY